MRKIRRRKKPKQENEILLEEFTKLLFLVQQYFDKQSIPTGWGLGKTKKNAEKELKRFLEKYGVIKTVK